MARDDALLLPLLLIIYIVVYKQSDWSRHPYITPVTYASFEFSLDAWDNERQRRMMRYGLPSSVYTY